MKAKIEKTLSAHTRSRVVRAKRSTPKKERRTKRKKNRQVSAKSRQETTKRRPLFPKSPHVFFNACTLRTPQQTKPAQKGGPTARNGATPPLQHSHIERKTNHRNKKKNKTLVYPEFWFYFCRIPPEKHTTSRDFLPTSHPPVLPLPLCRALGRLPFASFTFNLIISL